MKAKQGITQSATERGLGNALRAYDRKKVKAHGDHPWAIYIYIVLDRKREARYTESIQRNKITYVLLR